MAQYYWQNKNTYFGAILLKINVFVQDENPERCTLPEA
jgi:hypothetical protein